MFRTRLAIKYCKRNDYQDRGQLNIVHLNCGPFEAFEFCLTGFSWAFVKHNKIHLSSSAEPLKNLSTCSQTCLTACTRFLRWIRLNNKVVRNLGFGNKRKPERKARVRNRGRPERRKSPKRPSPKYSKARRPEEKAPHPQG